MQQIEEDDIVKRLRTPEDCRQAFTEVIALYSEPLYWQIRKMVISHEDANDLLQNTFLKAWANVENFRGEAKLSTWLYKIAINESITFLNKERQRQNISIDDDDTFLIDTLESDEWFDGDGMLIASPEPIWITSSIDAGESKYVSAVAPSAKARDFRLKLLGNVRGY